MAYTSDALKKEYKKETNTLRTNNLKKLRKNIAGLSLSDFVRETGITKNDISMLENGEKLLSLFHIQAYKKYFLKNHGIDLSVDYLMGYTDIMENSNMNFQNEIGLSSDALDTLKKIKDDKKLIETLNLLLSEKEKITPLLANMRMIIFSDVWQPCIATLTDIKKDELECDVLTPGQSLAFLGKDTTGLNSGVLLVDESILKSHSMLKIQEILDNYKKEVMNNGSN